MTLFINCCPRTESRTKTLADVVLKKYDDYKEINLYEMDLKPITENDINKRMELSRSNQLDAEEFKLARQFANADRVVIAAPFWDLSFPSMLKLYIENIYITGIVSEYDSNGFPKGLCKAKELIYVTTAGGPYDGRYSFDYLKTLCNDYFGIPEVRLVKADMMDIIGNDPNEILSKEIEKEYGF